MFGEMGGVDALIRSALCSDLHYASFERIAIAYDEIKTNKQDSKCAVNVDSSRGRNEIFEAIMQLHKFICFQVHRLEENFPIDDEPDFLMIFMPILVFDGNLFEAFPNSGMIDLQRRKHLLIKTNFLCPYCKKIETFTIDVVHRSYFHDFMQILKNDFQGSLKTLQINHEHFAERAKNQRTELKRQKS